MITLRLEADEAQLFVECVIEKLKGSKQLVKNEPVKSRLLAKTFVVAGKLVEEALK